MGAPPAKCLHGDCHIRSKATIYLEKLTAASMSHAREENDRQPRFVSRTTESDVKQQARKQQWALLRLNVYTQTVTSGQKQPFILRS